MTEEKPKKNNLTVAQKRGHGKGWAELFGMTEAYKPEVLEAQRKHVCQVEPCAGPDVCACHCHDVAKMVAKFRL